MPEIPGLLASTSPTSTGDPQELILLGPRCRYTRLVPCDGYQASNQGISGTPARLGAFPHRCGHGAPGGCPPYLDEAPAVQGGVHAARHLRREPHRAVAVAQPPAAPQAAHLGAAPRRRQQHRHRQQEDGGTAHGRRGDGAGPPGHVGARPGAAPRAPPAGR